MFGFDTLMVKDRYLASSSLTTVDYYAFTVFKSPGYGFEDAKT